jgi:hypothetical protein
MGMKLNNSIISMHALIYVYVRICFLGKWIDFNWLSIGLATCLNIFKRTITIYIMQEMENYMENVDGGQKTHV